MLRALLVGLICFGVASAYAQEQDVSIAAVVNDDIISTADVDARVKLVLATTNLSDTPEVRSRIRPQIIRALISERLQLQEAKRQGISVADSDIQQSIREIEKQRDKPEGSLMQYFAQNNIPKETFTSQVEAQIAWTKLVLRTVKPRVKVSEDDVERARRIVPTPEGPKLQEVQIAVLSLPVEKPEQEREMFQLSEKLSSEIKGGAQFESLARQFASSSGATAIIEPFWVTPQQLDPALVRALETTEAGTITAPVRTLAGYTIVKLYDKRVVDPNSTSEQEVMVKDILLRMKETSTPREAKVMEGVALELAKHPGDCKSETVGGLDEVQDLDIKVELRRAQPAQMSPALREMIEKTEVGKVTAPVATPEGFRIFMVCERGVIKDVLDHDKVKNQLLRERLELEAQKYLRNLRRDAFVDVRE